MADLPSATGVAPDALPHDALPDALPALPDDAGDVLLPAARAAVGRALGVATAALGEPPAWALEPGASFVSVTHDGVLRGCTGSLVARRPLLEDVQANAESTALHDRRFAPVTADELPLVLIEVSVLSEHRPLPASDLAEAYAALRPGIDGVIVEAGAWHRATFLPKMWERFEAPEVFLGYLWRKAGLEPGVWPEGTTLLTYTARTWREAPGAS